MNSDLHFNVLVAYFTERIYATIRPAEVFVLMLSLTSGAERSVRFVLQVVVRRQNRNVAEELSRTKIKTFWVRFAWGA